MANASCAAHCDHKYGPSRWHCCRVVNLALDGRRSGSCGRGRRDQLRIDIFPVVVKQKTWIMKRNATRKSLLMPMSQLYAAKKPGWHHRQRPRQRLHRKKCPSLSISRSLVAPGEGFPPLPPSHCHRIGHRRTSRQFRFAATALIHWDSRTLFSNRGRFLMTQCDHTANLSVAKRECRLNHPLI